VLRTNLVPKEVWMIRIACHQTVSSCSQINTAA
jgi:hypothetical protein